MVTQKVSKRKYDGLRQAKRDAIIKALRLRRTKAGAADELGIPESTLYRNLRTLRIRDSEWQ